MIAILLQIRCIMKNLLLVLSAIVFCTAWGACRKKPAPFVPAPIEYVKDIYITGTQQVGGSNQACYWKNGIKVILASSIAPCCATDVKVAANGDVYVCGYIGIKRQIVYWKNGVQYAVTSAADDCYAGCIDVEHDSVFIGGSKSEPGSSIARPYVWSRKVAGGGKEYQMSPTVGAISDLMFYKGVMHAVGTIVVGSNNTATHFENFKPFSLTTSESYANAIHIDSNNICISGQLLNGVDIGAVYWLNGGLVSLTTGANASGNDVDFYDGFVYTAGTVFGAQRSSAYWSNQARTTITDAAYYCEALNIDMISGDVYTMAMQTDVNLVSRIALYKNSTKTMTIANATPTSMFISKELK
jgi:hypothetical protein